MMTPWANDVKHQQPLPEYPRPQMKRAQWTNLNGQWKYAITECLADISDPGAVDTPCSVPPTWDGQITVPFSPEYPLSGVERTVMPHQTLWYQRDFTVTPEGNARTLLHFGAVDQTCRVAVNGVEVGGHSGGYLPFTLDITEALRSGINTLTVAVRDVTDSAWLTHGKQALDRGGIWYTPQAGIWQTVWLEEVPKEYIARVAFTPQPDLESVEIIVEANVNAEASVTIQGETFTVPTNTPFVKQIPGLPLWSPQSPSLVDARITLGEDSVDSYFAMRTFEAKDGKFLLNGEPIMVLGVLDQGYWPDGGYTAPSDKALLYDIETMKDMGFNTLRKHIKVEPLRWYYHCDRLGMMVWQDMPNGGRRPRKSLMNGRVLLPFWMPDKPGGVLGRQDADGCQPFEAELREMITVLSPSPSVVLWVPFNEGWGQFDAARIARLTRSLDHSRPVDHASGWFDQGAGDVRSVHLYFRPPFLLGRGFARRDHRTLALTEYGGFSLPVDGHTWGEATFGYAKYSAADDFQKAFLKLHERLIPVVKERGLRALIYTQLSDVEDEINGLVTYDRAVVKIDPQLIRDTLAELSEAAS